MHSSACLASPGSWWHKRKPKKQQPENFPIPLLPLAVSSNNNCQLQFPPSLIFLFFFLTGSKHWTNTEGQPWYNWQCYSFVDTYICLFTSTALGVLNNNGTCKYWKQNYILSPIFHSCASLFLQVLFLLGSLLIFGQNCKKSVESNKYCGENEKLDTRSSSLFSLCFFKDIKVPLNVSKQTYWWIHSGLII